MGRKQVSIERIVMRDGLRCHYCSEFMNVYHHPTATQQRDPRRFTFEHIVPKSKYGTYGLYNIVGCCAKCNSEAGNKFYKCFCDFCMSARARFEMKELLRYV